MKKPVLTIAVLVFFAMACAALGDSNVYVTKKDYPMALTLADLDLFHDSIVNNDTAVFLKLRQEGRAWMSRAGVEVSIVGTDGSDKIKIRPKNSTTEIWTLTTAVKKKGGQ